MILLIIMCYLQKFFIHVFLSVHDNDLYLKPKHVAD